MHSYTGPSGTRYHLDAEGSIEGRVHFVRGDTDVVISMRDVLWLSSMHRRSQVDSPEGNVDTE
jgi:hypothetical protein